MSFLIKADIWNNPVRPESNEKNSVKNDTFEFSHCGQRKCTHFDRYLYNLFINYLYHVFI